MFILFYYVSHLGGELVSMFVICCYCIFVIYCLSAFISTHAVMCSFECFRKDRYILIKIFYLLLQLLG